MSGLKNIKTNGFTLVELMIAVSVFSVVIIIGLYAFIQINNYYTKGVTIVRTQDAVRNLAADIATQFQLTSGTYKNQPTEGGPLEAGLNIACVGNKAYLYRINTIEGSEEGGAIKHAIWSYEVPVNTCPLPSEDTKLTYLLKPGVRLLQLDIKPHIDENNGPLYNITVALLYAPNDGADNDAGTDLVETYNGIGDIDKWNCKATVSGSQYCSLSKITTSVYKRIQ